MAKRKWMMMVILGEALRLSQRDTELFDDTP
jgi:hypothetical protein